MRRRYTRESYLELVTRLREAIPGIGLSTDMIVGFPGETAGDFEETLSLVEAAQFQSMFSFKYSPRPNTLALQRMADDVTEEEKTRRIVSLQSLQREIQTRLHEAAVGTRVEVLVDSVSRRQDSEISGRTGGNVVVNLPAPAGEPDLSRWIGRTVTVVVRRAGPHSLWGEPAGAQGR
jgi:tRNA-2-methylthio-N6-dimethylallyladenosine synthase